VPYFVQLAALDTRIIPFYYPLYPLLRKHRQPRVPPFSKSLANARLKPLNAPVPLRSTTLAADEAAPQQLDQPFGLTRTKRNYTPEKESSQALIGNFRGEDPGEIRAKSRFPTFHVHGQRVKEEVLSTQ
jgi:hypothetical protein